MHCDFSDLPRQRPLCRLPFPHEGEDKDGRADLRVGPLYNVALRRATVGQGVAQRGLMKVNRMLRAGSAWGGGRNVGGTCERAGRQEWPRAQNGKSTLLHVSHFMNEPVIRFREGSAQERLRMRVCEGGGDARKTDAHAPCYSGRCECIELARTREAAGASPPPSPQTASPA